ncbi:hypothetical protein N0V90_000266 [Kalmusia sp. IMI 367209]|nr:hypothetical protein N0V90_000266 [Kalmusia sp. IMI 367209]
MQQYISSMPTTRTPPSKPVFLAHVKDGLSMTSLLAHADFSMRANIDKEIEAIDLDQFFDQSVETNLFQEYSDATAGPSSSEDLSYLFEVPSSNESEPCDVNTMPNWESSREPDAWHKAIQRLEKQSAASPLIGDSSSAVYPHSGGKASVSDSQLLNFDKLFELYDIKPRTVSQPSTPKQQVVKPSRKAISSPDRSARHGVHKNPRKPTSSSIIGKMMRPSTYRTNFQDLWARKMDSATETFNLHMPPNGIQSPPPSTKLIQDEHSNGFFQRDQQPYTITMSPLPGDSVNSPGIQPANYQLTPLSSPSIDINSANGMTNPFQYSNDSMTSAYLTSAALSALKTPPSSNRIPMATWGSDTSPNLDFGSSFSTSPDYQSATKTTGWWNGAGSVPITQPSTPSTYQSSNSRSASQNMSFSTASIAGLGISCDNASFSEFGPELNGSPSGMHSASSYDRTPYLAVYPTTPGIPIGHAPANPPSRSPTLSPQPRFTRRRHSSQNHHRGSHASRRKSSNSSNQSSSQRNGPLGGGFVNFTPDDSRKILTGVAPSGSSKTKARREKEAAEKRRKLSQAAVKAVMEAGGDIGRLEKEGLLVLES